MRLTFRQVEAYAKERGVVVERAGRIYEAYREDNHSVIAEAGTLSEILEDVDELASH